MAVNIQLNTALSTIERLHKIAESSAKKVSLEPEVLRLLLLDHSVMFRAISDLANNSNNPLVRIKEPKYRKMLE